MLYHSHLHAFLWGQDFFKDPAYSGCNVFEATLWARCLVQRQLIQKQQIIIQTMPACPGCEFSPLYKHICLAAQQIGIVLSLEEAGKYDFGGLVYCLAVLPSNKSTEAGEGSQGRGQQDLLKFASLLYAELLYEIFRGATHPPPDVYMPSCLFGLSDKLANRGTTM